ncbi:hypothetical protein ECC02_010553 [Trypanosoma cruzi]|uniref:Uncharacterized protein n=1 Tax=Trypanosoma cruzi TaxID=5693 RepID=A0A7J6XR08_TRYCR|nr:hypothetical protein ECC02_010553 [Trypanosoma cruzi]
MLRLGDPHIVVVLTSSPGTAHTDALSGRSEASFEALQGTGCVDAATTCMECHDGTVSCGWWNIYFSEATERERELLLLLASLLPFFASHADYCLSTDHGWCASTSDVVCRHFTATMKHTSRRMLWLWIWCRACCRHYFADSFLLHCDEKMRHRPSHSLQLRVLCCQHKTLLLSGAWLTVKHHCVGTCKDVVCRSRCWAPLFGCGGHTSGCIVAQSNA